MAFFWEPMEYVEWWELHKAHFSIANFSDLYF